MASAPPPDQTLRFVVIALQNASVPYMVTGSYASSVHGEPRATQDLDIVIAPTARSLSRFLNAFPEDRYYFSREAAREALNHRTMFNIIEFATGWKIDLMICKDRPFSIEEFSRRSEAEVDGQPLMLASAEDVILAKLEWAKSGGSARQLEDVAAVFRTARENLDYAYIDRWSKELGIDQLWQDIRNRSTQS